MVTTSIVGMSVIDATDRKLFYSRSELMVRGWSHTAMRLFLHEPDCCAPHPLYRIDRTHEAERISGMAISCI